MKNKYFFFVITLATLTLIALTNTSCKHVDYNKQITTLDSLGHLMHLADSTLKIVDTTLVKKDANHIMADLQLIKMSHTDSMSKGAAEIFRNFSSLRWQLETFIGRRTVMRLELNKSINQLSHLSHDLNRNLVNTDSASFFVALESKKAGLLVESEKMSMQALNNQLPLYNLIAPQADSLIALIKNHKDL